MPVSQCAPQSPENTNETQRGANRVRVNSHRQAPGLKTHTRFLNLSFLTFPFLSLLVRAALTFRAALLFLFPLPLPLQPSSICCGDVSGRIKNERGHVFFEGKQKGESQRWATRRHLSPGKDTSHPLYFHSPPLYPLLSQPSCSASATSIPRPPHFSSLPFFLRLRESPEKIHTLQSGPLEPAKR